MKRSRPMAYRRRCPDPNATPFLGTDESQQLAAAPARRCRFPCVAAATRLRPPSHRYATPGHPPATPGNPRGRPRIRAGEVRLIGTLA
jgi:hypothetical protein